MSPPGDDSASKRGSKQEARERATPFAFPRSGAVSETSVENSRALPLRLSIAQQGLGIELSHPVDVGLVVVEQLDVALLNVKFPVDLSKGVKQFLSRRGELRHLEASLDLLQLGRLWGDCLSKSWKEAVTVRLRLVFEAIGPHEDVAFQGKQSLRADNDAGQPTAVAVSIHSDEGCLAFDLVLCSGHQPRFAVDAPRAAGRLPECLKGPPLLLAFQALDGALGLLDSESQPMHRRGRTIELNDLARVLALAVLPRFGCRLPRVEGQVVRHVESRLGKLKIVLGATEQPFTAGHRALDVSGRAALSLEADTQLATGELSAYRASLLELLDAGPAQRSLLLDLAELDLCEENRAEAVLAEVEELGLPGAESQGPNEQSPAASSRHCLVLARALDVTGRGDSATGLLEQAASLEPNGVLSAFLALELSRREPSTERRRELLNQGVARAPFLMSIRMERLRFELESGKEERAQHDAERLDASLNESEARLQLGLELGRLFLSVGSIQRADCWLKRCLRLAPENPEVLLSLAECQSLRSQPHRAAELSLSALRILESGRTQVERAGGELRRVNELEELSARINLARLRSAQYLRKAGVESGQVLAHLAAIEQRSSLVFAARMLAAEIYDEEGRHQERDEVLVRLLDSIQLGHVREPDQSSKILGLLSSFRGFVGAELKEFAERVLLQS